jgi:DNA-binding CsgD family transcriptional regulator
VTNDADRATLVAVLEALPGPALVVTATGFVVHANAAAEARCEADPGLVGRIQAGTVPGVVVSRIPGTPHRLVQLPAGHDLEVAVARAIERWTLTRAEARVLCALATGASYASMARSLRLSERAVEFHVSNILTKAGVQSSTQLIASLTRA